jgi:hypothetical protein
MSRNATTPMYAGFTRVSMTVLKLHGPAAAAAHAPLVEILGDGARALTPYGVEIEDLLEGRYFRRDRPQVLGVRIDLQSLGCDTEGPLALGGLALHAVDDPVDDHFTFELGEHAEHLYEHASGGSGGVERLGGGAEHDAGLVEFVEQPDQVAVRRLNRSTR